MLKQKFTSIPKAMTTWPFENVPAQIISTIRKTVNSMSKKAAIIRVGNFHEILPTNKKQSVQPDNK